ncbi:tRNA pseudouridine(55) synthase TruB [Gorillibacterium sp. sgz5001074]|uniref:tRNA pseudouridine(55) synthase TruB n=1 Tax=Gorillibacterium sp. sgz5001074 TaxID=3446695 RepID=UPI003F66ABEC
MKVEGIIPIWKPQGFTSHDVVAKARRILRIKRIGHTGTLDPAVTGVLPLCIGRATRLVEYIQEMPKEYQAKLIIGLATDTEDMTGTVVERSESVSLDPAQVLSVLESFAGEIQQVPPMYSAVKVDGKRLYELARKGEIVERKPRAVTIYAIQAVRMSLETANPEIEFRVSCSKGTYIRTLCVDIGRALGYPAVMGELIRTSTGGFTREQCVTLEELAEAAAAGEEVVARLTVPSDDAIPFIPRYSADKTMALHALQGKKLRLPEPAGPDLVRHDLPGLMAGLVRLYDEERFLGLFRLHEDGRTLSPEKVFVPEQEHDPA